MPAGRPALRPADLALVRALLREAGARHAVAYGSRARGDARPGSDLDLAVAGLDERAVSRLRANLDEAPLPFTCDVVNLDTLPAGPLRAAIERDGAPVLEATAEP